MGWCSATEIFDDMAQFVIMSSVSEEEKFSVLLRLAIILENNDWDCQQDSKYYDDVIVRRVFKELHPHWFLEPCPECGGSGRRTGTGMMEDPNDPTGEPLPYPIEVLCGTCAGHGFMEE